MIKIPALLFVAFVLYSIAFVGNFFPKTRERTKALLSIFAIAFHTGAMWEIFLLSNSLPTSTIYELLESIGWFSGVLAIIGFMFGVKAFKKIPLIVASALTILPALCPHFVENITESAQNVSGIEIQIHALFAALSYAMMFAGFLMGLAYLRKYYALKNKKPVSDKVLGVSLEALCKGMKRSIFGAMLAMGISLWLGFISLPNAQIDTLMQLKILAGICVLIVQVYIFGNVALQSIKDASLAKLAVALMIVSVLAFVPIILRSTL